MKLALKRMMAAGMLAVSLGLVAGCGSAENAGVVDMNRVATESAKAKEVQAKVEVKFAEINNRLAEAQANQSPEEFAKTQQEAVQEYQVYQQAIANEVRNTIFATAQAVAQEKKLTIVVEKGAVISGGVDVTEEVMKKLDGQTESKEEAKK